MAINNDDQRTLIKANKKVIIEKKRQVGLNNIKVAKDLRLLKNEKFISKVKKMLNLQLEVRILVVVNHVFNLITNDFIREV
jgi:hypothetical protein